MRPVLIVTLLCLGASVSQIEGKCSKNFGGCDKSRGLCWDTAEGTSFCTCKAGYNFKSPSTRSGKCVNINECKTGVHSCDTVHGKCVDTIGSHRCVCNRKYVLDFTKTTCLRKNKVKGTCRTRSSRRRSRYYKDENKDNDKFYGWLFNWGRKRKQSCRCETGYELRNGCKFCQDINECKRRTSHCDLKRGSCHNSVGGYYCSCKNGYVLGPCRFKCYKPSKRPKDCTSKVFKTSSLIKGDSDGLNDEVSKAVLLDYITEKTAKSGKIISALETSQYKNCSTKKAKSESFDVNRDGKTDLIIKFACVNGRWEAKGTFDKQAYWTQWTCWTECRPTIYGGIQTRARICKNGLVGQGKCKGPATKYKSCYHGKLRRLRVRRNALSLSKKQKNDLVQAMRKYKKDTSTNGFWNAAGSHIFPKQCMAATGKPDGCCYHGAKLNFIMWHRAELLNFEEGLTRHLKDKTLGLPYWDWVTYDKPPSLVWNKKYGGKSNPFANMTIRFDLSPVKYLARLPQVVNNLVLVSRNAYQNVARKLMKAHTIHEFSEELENAHNTIHAAVCVGDGCTFSMGDLTYAAFDPIFFFHHTNVDRLFTNFQNFLKKQKQIAWTRQSALEPQQQIYRFNEPYQPFRNKTLTSFKRVNVLPTMQDLFYYQHMLGYKYDTLKVPKPVAKKSSDAEKEHVAATNNNLMIMLYERSIRRNVKVSYYAKNKIVTFTDFKGPCSKLNESDKRFVGSVTIMGSKKERAWKSRQPVLTQMDKWFTDNGQALGRSGLKKISNIDIVECYTHKLDCTKNCAQISSSLKQEIPSSQLMLYPRYISEDVLKFRWDAGIRMPTWTINIDSGSQWIYFWGAEAKHILQTSSRKKFNNCDKTGAKKVSCTGSCVLPSGYHYFIHKNKSKCKKGLKLEVLSVL